MKRIFTQIAKRNISLVIMILLTIVCCGSIDLSCDYFDTGGSIKGSSPAISHSLVMPAPAAVRKDDGRSGDQAQDIEKTSLSSDIFSRIARKLLQLFGDIPASGSMEHFKSYLLSVCIFCFAFLFLLTNVRFIHLKDGSK